MKYLINSSVNFSKHTLKILIPSLLDCGIDPKDILVILGGSENNSDSFIYTGLFMCLNVRINAIDQTSFYAMKNNESIFPDDSYYYMHDTTKVGPDFKKKIEGLNDFFVKNNLKTYKNNISPCGNMGFYTKSIIIETLGTRECYINNEKVLTDEENSNDPNKLEIKKKISFSLEDQIFKKDSETLGFQQSISDKIPHLFPEKIDIYGTKNHRLVSYHKDIDLYKYGGNADLGNNNPLTTFLGCKI